MQITNMHDGDIEMFCIVEMMLHSQCHKSIHFVKRQFLFCSSSCINKSFLQFPFYFNNVLKIVGAYVVVKLHQLKTEQSLTTIHTDEAGRPN